MPRLLYENGSHLRDVDGKAAQVIDWQEFTVLLFLAKNRFLRVYACSNRENRLRKTGNPYRGERIEKVVCYTVRNGYRYYEAVEKEVAKNGGNPDDVERWGRSWGRHLRGAYHFTIHRNRADRVNRLHAYLMPVKRHVAEWTGYYVNGEKIDDAELQPFERDRPEPETVVDAAKAKRHPYEPRLEDILYVKLGGVFYRIQAPTTDEVNALADSAEENEPAVA